MAEQEQPSTRLPSKLSLQSAAATATTEEQIEISKVTHTAIVGTGEAGEAKETDEPVTLVGTDEPVTVGGTDEAVTVGRTDEPVTVGVTDEPVTVGVTDEPGTVAVQIIGNIPIRHYHELQQYDDDHQEQQQQQHNTGVFENISRGLTATGFKNVAISQTIEEEEEEEERNFPPRIAMVCRQSIRKNKKIGFVGELHIEWLQRLGAIPIILPRTEQTLDQIKFYLPFDGILLVESEDLSLKFKPYDQDVDDSVMRQIKSNHPFETLYDESKDNLEWLVMKSGILQNIPILGICRGCQLLNVVCGGTLYYDIVTEVENAVKHIAYENSDDYRHKLTIVPNTPLAVFYQAEIGKHAEKTIEVNSYHHQGIKRIGNGLKPMAFSSADGVVEGIYNPATCDVDQGKFCMGIQYHPERLGIEAHSGGGFKLYEAFVAAARSFAALQRKRERKKQNI